MWPMERRGTEEAADPDYPILPEGRGDWEIAEANTKEMHSSASALQQINKVLQSLTPAEKPQNAVNKLWQSQQPKMPQSCGKSDHDPSQCRYRLCKCHNCGKLHIRPVCKQLRSRGRPVMMVQEDLDGEH